MKSILILGATISLFSLQSCVKKYCYDCTTTRTETMMPENIVIKSEKSTVVHCDQTAQSIEDIEKNGTSYTTFDKGGKVHQEQTTTKCVPY